MWHHTRRDEPWRERIGSHAWVRLPRGHREPPGTRDDPASADGTDRSCQDLVTGSAFPAPR